MSRLRHKFAREVAALGLPVADEPLPEVTEDELASLPDPARRYLRASGVVGRPRDWSFRAGFVGRFKISRAAPWRPCEVWQYSSGLAVARVFYLRLRMMGLPVVGRDVYLAGKGRMVGKVFDLIKVIDGSGPEYDVGELVTYLNDLVLFAPSMLLVPAVSWTAVDEQAFDLALTDCGRTVTARIFVDERGAVVDFETTDRFCEDPKDRKRLVRTRWTTPMRGRQSMGHRRLPVHGQAVWHPPEGASFAYVELEVDPAKLAYDVRPGD